MRGVRRWILGDVEVSLTGFEIPAGDLVFYSRVESAKVFLRLVEGWLADPHHRAAVLEMSAEVDLPALSPPMGRGSRTTDSQVIAGLVSAFTGLRLHVLRKTAPRFAFAAGPGRSFTRRWKFKSAQVLPSGHGMKVEELVDWFYIQDVGQYTRHIDKWLTEADERPHVLDLYRTLAPTGRLSLPDSDPEIAADLLQAFIARKLFLLKPKLIGGGAGDEDGPDSPQEPGQSGPATRAKKTWIEVVLIDEDDRPVPGVKYKLRVTDGSTREGSLDDSGSVRVNGIDPGTCEVTFPELDANDWRPA